MLLQILSGALAEAGVRCTFDAPPPVDRAFRTRLEGGLAQAEREALEEIAAALRKPGDDFRCIEEILFILERLGYDTLPRHDF